MVEKSEIDPPTRAAGRAGSGGTTPRQVRPSLRQVGPGLVLAATCVGVGDMVTAIVAAEKTQHALVWAFIAAVIIKYYVTIAIGRWNLATGKTIVQGFRAISVVAIVLVAIYAVIWGLMFGAAGPSVVGLSATAMFPVFNASVWAIIHGVAAFIIVLVGRYRVIEQVMKVCVGLMFVGMVGAALLVRPDFGSIVAGIVPTFPDGSVFYVIGIIGGVGGTLTLTAYGYWVREKGWRGREFLPMMKLDSVIGYIATAIFAISVLVIGATFLYSSGRTVDSAEGLLALADPLRDSYGQLAYWLFLVGFWAISFSSVLGVWSGVSYLFADIIRNVVNKGKEDALDEGGEDAAAPLRKTKSYRFYLILLTFPSIPVMLLGSPVFLVLAWVTLGALFMPFLTAALLYLLNAKKFGARQPGESPFSMVNIVLAFSFVLFVVLMASELVNTFS
jgi:Mn2+/Fe2+ NRAMP family transporter